MTAWLIVALSSTASLSCAAVTVTCCAVFQVDVVNVSVGGENVTSLLPVRDGVTVTLAVGWLFSTTV